MRAANLLVRVLSAAGVKRLFTLSGNQIMPVFDACLDKDVELIHVRHEAAAVHMADAWGRLTGEPGIALVTAGPGFLNALSACFVALQAESPLVLLSGQSPRDQQGRGAFQELAQAETGGPVTKASWTVDDPAEIGHQMARALRLAQSGRPGPVHVALPVDVLEADVSGQADAVPRAEDVQPSMTLLDGSAARSILESLEQARRPLILAGPALARCGSLLEQLADATGVPAVGMESPRGINDPCLGAFAEVLAQSDVVVLLSKQLDFSLQFGSSPAFDSSCRFLQIDPEMRILERTGHVLADPSRLLMAELADPLPAAERLVQEAGQTQVEKSDWYREVQQAIGYRPPEWENLASPGDGPLTAVEVCRAVQPVLDDDPPAVLVSDGGEFGQWVQACLTAPDRLINGPSGAIGSALPFAIAAGLARPDSQVVCFLGDGTFGFHPLEFDTAIRYGVPFVAIVGNDACWNAERQIQRRKYGDDRLIGCDLLPTRYDKVVESLGGHGEQVQRAAELPAALERALSSKRPACVNVAVRPDAAPLVRRSG